MLCKKPFRDMIKCATNNHQEKRQEKKTPKLDVNLNTILFFSCLFVCSPQFFFFPLFKLVFLSVSFRVCVCVFE